MMEWVNIDDSLPSDGDKVYIYILGCCNKYKAKFKNGKFFIGKEELEAQVSMWRYADNSKNDSKEN